MSVYSGTFAPTRPDGSAFSLKDPLADARDKLRQAARLPFHAREPRAWQSAYRQLVVDARVDIRHHIWSSELPDSGLNKAEFDDPRLLPRIENQRDEHLAFSASADELVAEASTSDDVDIWKMIEFSERAILLEMALARHHNRLTQIVYESTLRDIGGESG